VIAKLIPMHVGFGHPDRAEVLFQMFEGDATAVLDGLDAFVPQNADDWLWELRSFAETAEPHVAIWLLLRLTAIHRRLDRTSEARECVERAAGLLLDGPTFNRDAAVVGAQHLCELGPDHLYQALAERIAAAGRAELREQSDDGSLTSSVGTQHAAQALVAMGDLDRALELTRALQPFERDDLYDQIAAAHAGADRLDDALAVLMESAETRPVVPSCSASSRTRRHPPPSTSSARSSWPVGARTRSP
jgi:hypothetical protein